MSNVKSTLTNLRDLNEEEFRTLRSAIREAYDTRSAAESAAGELEGVMEFFAARAAAEAEFASRLTFTKNFAHNENWHDYTLSFDGVVIGRVFRQVGTKEWVSYAAPYRGAKGRRVCTDSTRSASASHALTSLAIYGNLGF